MQDCEPHKCIILSADYIQPKHLFQESLQSQWSPEVTVQKIASSIKSYSESFPPLPQRRKSQVEDDKTLLLVNEFDPKIQIFSEENPYFIEYDNMEKKKSNKIDKSSKYVLSAYSNSADVPPDTIPKHYRDDEQSNIMKTNNIPKKSNSNSGAPLGETIIKCPGKDIVIIDKEDIKEAKRNESAVTIVYQSLHDTLGSQWPIGTGPAAEILNSAAPCKSTSNSVTTSYYKGNERNKSINILTHLGSSKKDHHVGTESKRHCGKKSKYYFYF